MTGHAPDLDRTKLLAARFRAASERPYLASALYSLSVVPTTTVPTMGVDRYWRCYVSPAFVDATPVEELAGVWIHEAAHLLRDHHGRADLLAPGLRRDRLRVNIAQDCEINDDLIADGLSLPAGRVTPATYDLPPGRLFEEYLSGVPASGGALDCGSGAHGEPAPWDLGDTDGNAARVTEAEAKAIRRHTAEAMRAHHRGRGNLPAGWRRWAEQVLEPTVDWRRVLAGAVREALSWASGAADYTYHRPSRRGPALRGVVLPSLRRPLPRVAVVIDTSGSMGDDALATALAEVTGVLREVGVRGDRVTVLSVDADVQAASRVTTADQIELKGGGGTDMRVGIRRALDAPHPPSVVIVLTDGYTPWPDEPATCRLIAVLIGAGGPEPPSWAETIRVPTT
ncbi:vWA domain-containing protein [Actinomadura miaoliensis]|uniref:VWA-like domain-containing protein n=1 Tax=Actinomadura miaoliensis TaxID=430685 RepID=A0ABP7WHY0_9ACTN